MWLQGVEVGDAVHGTTASPSMMNCVFRIFRAVSTIQGKRQSWPPLENSRTVVALNTKPVAVVFDLVEPIEAARDHLLGRGNAELNVLHRPAFGCARRFGFLRRFFTRVRLLIGRVL